MTSISDQDTISLSCPPLPIFLYIKDVFLVYYIVINSDTYTSSLLFTRASAMFNRL